MFEKNPTVVKLVLDVKGHNSNEKKISNAGIAMRLSSGGVKINDSP